MKYVLITLGMLCCWLNTSHAQQDAAGSEDHPLISRYPGSHIDWYDVQQYDTYHLPLGPVTGYRHIDEWQELNGKISRIYYRIKGVRSHTEIYQNYLQALRQAGFELLVQGSFNGRNVRKEVGGGNWMGVAYAANPLPPNGKILLLTGSSTSGGDFFVAGKLQRPQGDVYVVVGGHQYKADEVVYLIDVIEVEPLESGLVEVDADAMGKAIDQYGKVALYGIYFEFDQDKIKAESEPALQEIASLLQQRPALQLYVVGHTDMKGGLGYNLDLSQRRANAVVEALIARYGIARSRLEARGVGPLVPVSTNRQDAGRAQNRRVELVEKGS